jgi:hypothetical protein
MPRAAPFGEVFGDVKKRGIWTDAVATDAADEEPVVIRFAEAFSGTDDGATHRNVSIEDARLVWHMPA